MVDRAALVKVILVARDDFMNAVEAGRRRADWLPVARRTGGCRGLA